MEKSTETAVVQLWGGVECTVNRVQDRYCQQLLKSGHIDRVADLNRFAQLGLRKIRYPLLWETNAPNGVQDADWTWADERFGRLRELNLEPIAGLVHHGSGPSHTSLLDSSFAPGLASFARACAERYPWITDYTPINEPLTTARFSGLYGIWYPHHRSSASFVRALVNETRATVLAMKEIRAVNPRARLIQTEDVGTVTSARRLSYQAAFENERRWLSLDLLCGRVDPDHPLYDFMCKGASEAELAFFCENPCPPDVIGVNYYVTSDRFLDHNLGAYPASMHGGNGRDAYVDIEAVRTPTGINGHANQLRATWQRYRLPLAITEVHLDCHREEQLRWLDEAWQAANLVKSEGATVEAVTVWSLLGAYDWNSLCTKDEKHYESGPFDVRSGQPRPTAVARAIESLSDTGTFSHPTMRGQGWWRRTKTRILNESGNQGRSGCFEAAPKRFLHLLNEDPLAAQQLLLIVSDGGPLSRSLIRACEDRELEHSLSSPGELQRISQELNIRLTSGMRPWAVVHAAHAQASATAAFATAHNLPFLTFFTDLVTQGEPHLSFDESHLFAFSDEATVAKLGEEALVQQVCPHALLVRSGPLFGATTQENAFAQALSLWKQSTVVVAPDDVFVAPAFTLDVAHVALDLLIDEEQGVWHFTHQDPVSWLQVMQMWAALHGVDDSLVRAAVGTKAYSFAALHVGSALTSKHGHVLPSLQSAFARHAREVAEPAAILSQRKARSS
ncbi:MAG: sugar nucleotide-binding protein [Deltaproteobacteria bacterium]|nr:sugar nucleotide-binding protein [Deltaproteobacteria bacterium]